MAKLRNLRTIVRKQIDEKKQKSLDNLDLIKIFGIEDSSINKEAIEYGIKMKFFTKEELESANQFYLDSKQNFKTY